MKASLVLLAAAIGSVAASPIASSSTSPKYEVITIVIGNVTWVGEPGHQPHHLSTRSAECTGAGLGFTSACIPGNCDCGGINGCWSFNGHPFQCQCGPDDFVWAAHNCLPFVSDVNQLMCDCSQ